MLLLYTVSTYSRLHHLATVLTQDDVEAMVLMAMQLAHIHASHIERVYNLLQYLLEIDRGKPSPPAA